MSNKWKASLLKSSLPLEQMTAELICKNNFHIGGEFAYSKMNNEGKYVDFSVDLLASKMKEHRSDIKVWSDLNLLVECKYSSPNIQWIFSTYPKLEPMCASTVQTYESALPVISIKTPLNKLEKDAFYGINGFALTDTSFDNKRIRHGLNQLRNAIPSLVKKLIDSGVNVHDRDEIGNTAILYASLNDRFLF